MRLSFASVCLALSLVQLVPCPALLVAGVGGLEVSIVVHEQDRYNLSLSTQRVAGRRRGLCLPGKFRSGAMCYPCRRCGDLEVMTAACGATTDTVCVPDVLAILEIEGLSVQDRLGLLNQVLNLSVAGVVPERAHILPADQVSVQLVPCPAGAYRSSVDNLCHLCRLCPTLQLETVACSDTHDRLCGPVLDVGLEVYGAYASDLRGVAGVVNGTGALVREDVRLDVVRAACAVGQYRSTWDGLCYNCTRCGSWDLELRACAAGLDRVCKGMLRVELALPNGFNMSLWNLDGVRSQLAYLLEYSEVIVDHSDVAVAWVNTTIIVELIPCAQGQWVNASALACQNCSDGVCRAGEYLSLDCAADHDYLCLPCTPCVPPGVLVAACGDRTDTVCEGGLEVDLLVQNASWLTPAVLLALLERGLESVPGVEPGYLAAWRARHGQIVAKPGYELAVAPLICNASEFIQGQACMPCTSCGQDYFILQACSAYQDAVCQACQPACGPWQYEARACLAGQDRLCFSYVERDAWINITVSTQINATELEGLFVPVFLEELLYLTLARNASLAGLVESPAGTGMFNLSIWLTGVYSLNPGYASNGSDFTLLVQRALYNTNETFMQAGFGRRLLQAGTCPTDWFPYDYGQAGGLGVQCVPCLDDPVPGATNTTPLLLRWRLAAADTCPFGYARACFGGHSAPVCEYQPVVVELAGAAGWFGVPVCPDQQVVVLDPGSGLPVCVGIPCDPGSTGPPGYCTLCQSGTYKYWIGEDPCASCTSGSYATGLGGTAASDCLDCPPHAWSLFSSTVCECNAGFIEFAAGESMFTEFAGSCEPCAPGTYTSGLGQQECLGCLAGSYASGPGSGMCDTCARGMFGVDENATACASCDAGAYQDHLGASVCEACDAGFFASSPAASACAACLPGWYAGLNGSDSCASCEPGTYSRANSSACLSCPDGEGVRNNSCAACVQGQYR